MLGSRNLRQHHAAFTILEVLIAASIISMLYAAIATLFMTCQQSYEHTINTTNVETHTAIATQKISDLMKGAKIIGIETHDSQKISVIFQVPVDWDNDGDVIDGNNEIEWGADGLLRNESAAHADNQPVNWLGRVYILRYYYDWMDWQFAYNEWSDGVDYNNNGYDWDWFYRGTIYLEIYDNRNSIFFDQADGVDPDLPLQDPAFNDYIYWEVWWNENYAARLNREILVTDIASPSWVDWNWQGPGYDFPAINERWYDLDGDGGGDIIFNYTIVDRKVEKMHLTIAAFARDSQKGVYRKIRRTEIGLRNTQNESVRLYRYGWRYY